MSDKELQIAPLSIVDDLVNRLKAHWPNTLIPIYILRAFQKLRNAGLDKNVTFLTPGGTVDEFATFALSYKGNLCFYSTHSKPEDVIMTLLKDCPYIDWSLVTSVGPMYSEFAQGFKNLFKLLNRKMTGIEELTHYWSEPQLGQSLTYTCPPEIYVAPLQEEHAEKINSLWDFKSEISLPTVMNNIKVLGGTGIFLKETNELVSWVINTNFGCIGVLHTIESHRRKGYGELVVTIMTKSINDEGEYVNAFVVKGNVKSEKLFEKLKYTTGPDLFWLLY